MPQKRRLINIPIIHSRADYGSLGNKVPVDQEYETEATEYWQAITKYIQNLPVNFLKLKVYQDALPAASAEITAKIVDETQTPNYNLLRWLRDKGARIMGTENPRLLLQEYRALQTIFNVKNKEQKYKARKER